MYNALLKVDMYFLGDVGGSLGLFIGTSILGLFEIIWLATIGAENDDDKKKDEKRKNKIEMSIKPYKNRD